MAQLKYYIIRRAILIIPVLIGVTLITFTLLNFVADPVSAYVTSENQLKNPNAIKAIIRRYHLDADPLTRYGWYILSLIKGDWGYSRVARRPVIEAIQLYFPATFELTMVAMFIALSVGIPLGVTSALKRNKPIDHGTRLMALSGVSMPIFWLGLILQLIFYYYLIINGLPHLPQNQRYNIFLATMHPIHEVTGILLIDTLITGNFIMFFDVLSHIILPAITLGYASTALFVRITRSSMLEVLRQDYMTLARAKGLPENVVIYKHALRNALIPTVTVAGLAFAGLLAGAVLTETIFDWPGLGTWSTAAIMSNDIAAIMGFTLLVAIMYSLANLIVDLMYGWLDPRIRLE